MQPYPKKILDIEQQIRSYLDAGMQIDSLDEAKSVLDTIGYYRLRGYCYHLYDSKLKQFKPGTSLSDIVQLYRFDMELALLLFRMSMSIEVALRTRVKEALLIHGDPLILMDPTIFKDKKLYWNNLGIICSEISRSSDVFISHNYDNHGGEIPLWAAVEVMSFGTLSKIVKNLKTGPGSSFENLAEHYKYVTISGNNAKPTQKMLCSWIYVVSTLRNICAHNSRIYNRSIHAAPELLKADQSSQIPTHNGLYQAILAMKYLRPNNKEWMTFFKKLKMLFEEFDGFFEYQKINFPKDWENHFNILGE